jgi:hypothetical protein
LALVLPALGREPREPELRELRELRELVREPERRALARVLRELAPQGPELREPELRFRGWRQASGARNRRKGLPR